MSLCVFLLLLFSSRPLPRNSEDHLYINYINNRHDVQVTNLAAVYLVSETEIQKYPRTVFFLFIRFIWYERVMVFDLNWRVNWWSTTYASNRILFSLSYMSWMAPPLLYPDKYDQLNWFCVNVNEHIQFVCYLIWIFCDFFTNKNVCIHFDHIVEQVVTNTQSCWIELIKKNDGERESVMYNKKGTKPIY